MEPAQIRQATDEYERLLGEDVEPKTTTDLLDALTLDDWMKDCGDYLVPEGSKDLSALLATIKCAQRRKDGRREEDAEYYGHHVRSIGEMVLANVCTTINELHERDLL